MMWKILSAALLCHFITGCSSRSASDGERSGRESYHDFRMEYDIDYRNAELRKTGRDKEQQDRPRIDPIHRELEDR